MWFKNLRLYRLTETLNISTAGIVNALSKRPFTGLTALQEAAFGWVPPFSDSQQLCELVGDRLFITAQIQEKLLPAAVLNEALAEKVTAIEEAEGRRPGRKERDQLKEDIRAELLPKAFHKTHRVSAWLDRGRGWLAINAGSEKAADDFTAQLREAIGSLPVIPLGKAVAGGSVLTQWYQEPATRPSGTEVIADLDLVMMEDPTVKAKYRNLALEAPEISHSLESGMRIRQMGLLLNDQCQCVIDDTFTLKRLKFTDSLVEQASDSDDPRTDALLMSDTLTQWLDGLMEQLDEAGGDQ